MSMNAKERLQALRNVDAGIEALLELKRRMQGWTDEEWNQGAFCLGIVLPEPGAQGPGEEEQKAQSKEQEIRAKAQALGLSVLEGGLGNGWKN